MQGSNCPNCGAPVYPGAQFCAYCGATVPTAASPLPPAAAMGAPAAAAPAPATMYGSPPAAPRRRNTRTLIVVGAVVLILIVGFVAFSFLASPTPAVQVGSINIWAPDNVCGLNSNPIYFDGFSSGTGASQVLDFFMPNYNGTACTVNSVTTNTSGFALSDIQVPLSIPAGGVASMNITITSPSSSYSGNMNLVLA